MHDARSSAHEGPLDSNRACLPSSQHRCTKAASLGFVTPGMRAEYGCLSFPRLYCRVYRAPRYHGGIIHLGCWRGFTAAVSRRSFAVGMFVGTSIWGGMPSFLLEYLHVFHDGTCRGCLLPVATRDHADQAPPLVSGAPGGTGTVGGAFATSAISEAPCHYLADVVDRLPTGLIRVVLGPLLPESARFPERCADEAREVACSLRCRY